MSGLLCLLLQRANATLNGINSHEGQESATAGALVTAQLNSKDANPVSAERRALGHFLSIWRH